MAETARPPGRRMTNKQFGDAIGVSEGYASLIRRGKRLPGAGPLVEIAVVFELDANKLVSAYREGPQVLAEFLHEQVPRVE